jgi:hypothetical protein
VSFGGLSSPITADAAFPVAVQDGVVTMWLHGAWKCCERRCCCHVLKWTLDMWAHLQKGAQVGSQLLHGSPWVPVLQLQHGVRRQSPRQRAFEARADHLVTSHSSMLCLPACAPADMRVLVTDHGDVCNTCTAEGKKGCRPRLKVKRR